jgi:hypothetical protein
MTLGSVRREYHGPACAISIRNHLFRPEAPRLIDTADLRHLKWSATSAMSSSLALPSTGGDRSRASQVPPSTGSNALVRELGLTLTCISVIALSFIGSDNRHGGRKHSPERIPIDPTAVPPVRHSGTHSARASPPPRLTYVARPARLQLWSAGFPCQE